MGFVIPDVKKNSDRDRGCHIYYCNIVYETQQTYLVHHFD